MTLKAGGRYLHKSADLMRKWVKRYKETKIVDDLPNREKTRFTTNSQDKTAEQCVEMFKKNPTFRTANASAHYYKPY